MKRASSWSLWRGVRLEPLGDSFPHGGFFVDSRVQTMSILRIVIRHADLGLVLADFQLSEVGGGVAGVKVFLFDEDGIVKGRIRLDPAAFRNFIEIGKIWLDEVK